MFSVEVRPQEKVFFFLVSGFFAAEEAINFLDTFKRKLQTIDPSEYTLVADGSTLRVLSQEMLPLLKQCMTLCQQAPFKKRYLVGMESPLALAQIHRLNQETGVEAEVVASMDDITY